MTAFLVICKGTVRCTRNFSCLYFFLAFLFKQHILILSVHLALLAVLIDENGGSPTCPACPSFITGLGICLKTRYCDMVWLIVSIKEKKKIAQIASRMLAERIR